MTRKIKFRAWDKHFKSWSIEKPRLDYVGDEKLELSTFDDDITIMQYTGLKDKNGKDIYEGDVLYFNKSKLKLYWDIKEACFMGKWLSGPCLKIRSNIEKFPINSNVMLFEVIGNIYKNPELLKGDLIE